MAEVQEGAVGVPIAVTIKNANGTARDISNSTTHNLIFGAWRGVKATKTADFLNDGSDGILVWTSTDPADLSPSGVWEIQAEIAQPGYSGKTRIGTFNILPNL